MNSKAQAIKLLLVDDEDDFREATSRVLVRRGFEVHQANSGESALASIEDVEPDLVVLDLKMGGMDGITTLRELRKIRTDIPVIILTGHGSFQDAITGMQLEIVDFLQKPVDLERLAVRVRALVQKGKHVPLRERSVAELMVPADSYARVYDDEPLEAAVRTLQEAFFQRVSGKLAEQGHRSVLVFDRKEHFVGLIRISSVVAVAIPPFLRDNPYASFFTGMFVAQCKTLGGLSVGDLVKERMRIDVNTPVMEAVHLMISNHMINLPVMKGDELVGILRDKDLLIEIAQCMGVG